MIRIVVLISFLCGVALLGQQEPPHVSAITPPPIPAIVPHLRKWPSNTMLLHVPPGKTAEMFRVGNMQTDELLERVRTNRYNLYLIEFKDAPPMQLKSVLVNPDEEKVLESFRRGQPQHP